MKEVYLGIFMWLWFGIWGFLAWRIEAYLKKYQLSTKDWFILLGLMLLAGFFGWLMSFRGIKHYLINK